MKSKGKVIFLLTLSFIVMLGIAYALDKCKGGTNDMQPKKDYAEQIRLLNDTIQELKSDIESYRIEINHINLERDTIKIELTKILKDNDKTDIELLNGSVDYNIKFLTEYLSQEGSD